MATQRELPESTTSPTSRIDRILSDQWARRALGVAYVLLLGVLAWPALTVPIGTDDSYWVLESAPSAGGSLGTFLHWIFVEMPGQPEAMGRFAEGSYILQRAADIVTMELAVGTGFSPWVFRVALKVLLLIGAFAVIFALASRLSRTTRDGGSQTLGSETVRVIVYLVPLIVLTGANAVWMGDVNGWVDYPVLTYGAVIVIFGTPLVMMWAVNHWLVGGIVSRVGVAIAICALSLFLNNSYELFFAAFPLGLLALVFYQASRDDRRARLAIAGIFSAAFALIMLYYRLRVREICSTSDCYDGAVVHLGPESARVLALNLFGAFPGGAGDQVKSLLWHVGWDSRFPSTFPPKFLVVGVLAGMIGYLLVRPFVGRMRIDDLPILGRFTLLGLAAALGCSVLVSFNERVSALLYNAGIPFRAGVVIWFGWALAISCGTLWLALRLRRARWLPIAGLLVVAAVAIGHVLPMHLIGARAYTALPAGQTVNRIHAEVALGDVTPSADDRRCALLEEFYSLHVPSSRRTRVAAGADGAFVHYHGTHFCSDKTETFDEPLGPGHEKDLQDR